MKRSFLFLISLFLCFSTFGAHVFYLHSGGEIVEDEKELAAVAGLFSELLGDTDLIV